MLTADLIRVRRRSNKIAPLYIRKAAFSELEAIAQMYIDAFAQGQGKTVGELQEHLLELDAHGQDMIRTAGLKKLLWDRCEVASSTELAPQDVRAKLWELAARERMDHEPSQPFDPATVIEKCAQQLGITTDDLKRCMFGDLPDAQRIEGFKSLSALQLLHRYNLALAQGVLFRAIDVTLRIQAASPGTLRRLFRSIKFHRLMHTISETGPGVYEIRLDGPLSLFTHTLRYGLQLAQFLPSLVAEDGWSLEANLRWGKDKAAASFELSPKEGLVSHLRPTGQDLEEVTQLLQKFSHSDKDWTVQASTRIFKLPGGDVFVPDLVFEHIETGRKVYLEAFGYWSREAVFRRVEALTGNLDEKFILAVSKRLRVHPDIAADGFPGTIVVYAQSILVGAIRRALDDCVMT